MTRRSVAAVIVLSLITCGIYMLYWIFVTCRDLQKESGRSEFPYLGIFLLSLFTGNAGGALMGLDADTCINTVKARRGLATENNRVLWTVLGAIIPIVIVGLIQHEINQILDNTPTSNVPPFGAGTYTPPQNDDTERL